MSVAAVQVGRVSLAAALRDRLPLLWTWLLLLPGVLLTLDALSGADKEPLAILSWTASELLGTHRRLPAAAAAVDW